MSPVTLFRVYLKIKPALDGLEGVTKMKLSFNVILQALSFLIQGANAIGGVLPPQFHVPVALGISVVQSVVALIAHFHNTDGTPQEQPGPVVN